MIPHNVEPPTDMLTHTLTLYLSTVFIWGSTFFAIRFQLGDVASEVSIAYRFGLAALILFVWCGFRGLSLRFEPKQHLWMLIQGISLFGINYVLVYWATAYLTSGLIAVIFSTIVLMNIVNHALFFRKGTTVTVLAGALLGLIGISFVFWPEFANLKAEGLTTKGLVFGLLGTFVASLGNMASARNQQAKLPVVQTNAFGMAYSTIALGLFALIQGMPFNYEPTLAYTGSLLYLAVFGSVLAFGSFLTLLGRIGATKAAYTMVLFPVVALGISTLFEGYQWTLEALLGVGLIFAGNLLVITPRGQLAKFSRKFRAATNP